FCYARPAHDKAAGDQTGEDVWSAEAGDVQWYLYDVASGKVLAEAPLMADAIRSDPSTLRHREIERLQLSDIRTAVEKHITKPSEQIPRRQAIEPFARKSW
ncbi:hypothetical protein ACC738_37495, partial [Rhizobium ruizarguesonis]